jgi:hypothetical protein
VTPEQISELRLETVPKKEGDNRAFVGETCQVEAIAPDMLATIVDDAISDRIDRKAWMRVLTQESATHAVLIKKLK